MALAQTTTSTTETKTFEVLAVDGNVLVVNLPEGTREITVPAGFRFTVNGQPMSVQQLKPGMKGTATITTKTTVTPVTVTEVKSGTVMQSSGSSIIVRTDEGVKMFTQADADKRGVKIMRDGQPAQITDLRQGDQLTATIITSKPPRVMTEKEVHGDSREDRAAAAAGDVSDVRHGTRKTQSSQQWRKPKDKRPRRRPGRCRRPPAPGRSSGSRASCCSRLGAR